jgi:hypothetical protein
MTITGIKFSYTDKWLVKECIIGELENGTPITVWRESNYNGGHYKAAYYKSLITPHWWDDSRYNKGVREVEKGTFEIYPDEKDFRDADLNLKIDNQILKEDPSRDITLYI